VRLRAAVLAVVVLVAPGASAADGWQRGAPLPAPHSELAAAAFRGGIAIVGGFRATGSNSRRVDLYLPGTNRWRRLPDLPLGLNHAAAASAGGRLYVVGGYGDPPFLFRRAAFVLEGKRWRKLRPMPGPRAAAGAAIVGGTLYVMGGVTPSGLAETAFALDLQSGRWSTMPGPRPREHLAVADAAGRVYALAGREGGVDSNLAVFEAYSPETRTWSPLPPVPEPRSGTGLAPVGDVLVSVGGEGPNATTIGSVFGFDLESGAWRRLPDLPTPRHGLGVVAVGTKVYAIGGSPVADLGFSSVNEYLDPN
jgi:Kelch motif/Galactose oxidase, central domain